MLLNVTSVLKNSDIVLNFSEEIVINNEELKHEALTFEKQAVIEGNLKNVGGVLVLSGKIVAEYSTFCDRCMAPVSNKLEFDFKESYVKDTNVEDDDTANLLESENIDIDEVAFSNIFSNIPLKHLCSEDCKGICQKCGANLNEVQCDCKDDEWNPQFEILKHLFD